MLDNLILLLILMTPLDPNKYTATATVRLFEMRIMSDRLTDFF